MSFTVTLPIRVVNTSNRREHWATRAKRTKAHRDGVKLALGAEWRRVGLRAFAKGTYRVVVTLARIAPRFFDDDGVVTSLKAVRDGVADALGINDNDPRVSWQYAQKRGPARFYAVEVTVEAAT